MQGRTHPCPFCAAAALVPLPCGMHKRSIYEAASCGGASLKTVTCYLKLPRPAQACSSQALLTHALRPQLVVVHTEHPPHTAVPKHFTAQLLGAHSHTTDSCSYRFVIVDTQPASRLSLRVHYSLKAAPYPPILEHKNATIRNKNRTRSKFRPCLLLAMPIREDLHDAPGP